MSACRPGSSWAILLMVMACQALLQMHLGLPLDPV